MAYMMRIFVAVAGASLLAGCSIPSIEPPLTANSPARPDAAETPLPVRSQTLAINDTPAQLKTIPAIEPGGDMGADMNDMPGMHHRGGGDAMPGMKHDAPKTQPGDNAALSAPRVTPGTAPTTSPAAAAAAYVCPMHKKVTSDQPGKCPICAMKLVPNKAAKPGTKPADASHAAHEHEQHGGQP